MREVRLHVEWPVRIDRRPRQRAVAALTPSPPAPVAHATVLITPPISSLALGGVEGSLEGLSVTFEEIEFGACLHVFHVEPLDVALRGGAHRGSWMLQGADMHAEAAARTRAWYTRKINAFRGSPWSPQHTGSTRVRSHAPLLGQPARCRWAQQSTCSLTAGRDDGSVCRACQACSRRVPGVCQACSRRVCQACIRRRLRNSSRAVLASSSARGRRRRCTRIRPPRGRGRRRGICQEGRASRT